MSINCSCCRKAVVAPNFFQQTIATDCFPGMRQKIFEELELFRREVQRLAFSHYLAATKIHFHVAEHVAIAILRAIVSSPQYRLYPRQQLANGEWLSHIVVGT